MPSWRVRIEQSGSVATDAELDLSLLADLVDARSTRWATVRASWAYVNERPNAESHATVLTVETRTTLIELTVWREGTANLIVADVNKGDIVSDEHYEVTGELGLRGVLDDLDAALDERFAPQNAATPPRPHVGMREGGMGFWRVLLQILANWKLMAFVLAVVVVGAVAEDRYGDNASLITLTVGIAGGAWLVRRVD